MDAIRGKFGSDIIQRGSAMESSTRVGRKYKAQMETFKPMDDPEKGTEEYGVPF